MFELTHLQSNFRISKQDTKDKAVKQVKPKKNKLQGEETELLNAHIRLNTLRESGRK